MNFFRVDSVMTLYSSWQLCNKRHRRIRSLRGCKLAIHTAAGVAAANPQLKGIAATVHASSLLMFLASNSISQRPHLKERS
jgi:hypothetical protein